MMIKNRIGVLGLALGAAGLIAAAAGAANADPLDCQRGAAKEAGKFLAKKSKLLSKCEESIAKGKLPPATDCVAVNQAKIDAAEAKLQQKVEDSCEGENPVTLGFPAACPDIEGHGCDSISLATPAGLGQCMLCLGELSVDQIYATIGLPLVDPAGNGALAGCQGTLAKESQKFLQQKSKAIQKCWDDRLKGKHSDVCPNPLADPKSPSGKAAGKIAKAQGKMIEKICAACGGSDEVCGGTDGMGNPNDFLPAQIGFPAECPEVTVPGGQECAVDVTSLQRLVDCAVCLSEFKADCVLSAATSQLEPYPGTCDLPVVPACSSADVAVEVQFTPPPADVSGIVVSLKYPGRKLETANVTQTNPGSGLFSFADLDTSPGDGLNDLLRPGLVAFGVNLAPGPFADVEFDCRDGAAGPDASEFSCTVEVADSQGTVIPATCSVSLTVNP